MNKEHFQSQVKNIYRAVKELELMFPGRPFTPDGHMVGSLGECLVAEAYGLDLMPPSNKGFDAKAKNGVEVEIKATQSKSVAFRSCPEHAIVIKIYRDGTFDELFNGPGSIVWAAFENKKLPTNGQYQISINKVKSLNMTVSSDERLPRIL